jgi:hypothetical protein
MQSNGSTFIQTLAKTENFLLLIHHLIYKAERTMQKITMTLIILLLKWTETNKQTKAE